ncbi:MAG: carboxypeptidase-like regulatory domain-containing protein, partial [archaeon]
MALEKQGGGLKEFYFGLEDKWYQAIDKIDSKIPIHGIVDRIDKIVPSFALFLVIVALIILLVAFQLFSAPVALFSFKVTDTDGVLLENASVRVFLDDSEVFSATTDGKGETGNARLVPGTKVTVSAAKTDFVEHSETIDVVESTYLYSIVLQSLEEKTYTISLKDSLGQPIREPVALSFACRNPDATPPAGITVSSGIATVTEPQGCNGLIVSLSGDGYDFKSSVELVQNQQTIYLQESAEETGTINAELYSSGELAVGGITVYLYKDNGTDSGLGPIETETSQNGRAVFEAGEGSYFLKTSGYGQYAAARSETFGIAPGDVKAVRIDLQKSIVGSVKAKIVNKVTNAVVDGARVSLLLGGSEIDTKVSSSDNDAVVEFPVSQDTLYTLVVDHEGYCLMAVHDAAIGSAAREIELTPVSQECGGMLEARVLDQSGNPVRNATVGLYNENGFSVGFGNLVSDINGSAVFSRVPSGDYKAFAFKESSGGWSDVEHFVQRTAEGTILTVVLIAGDGTVRVKVVDAEGQPLPYSQVAFVDAVTLLPVGGGTMPVQDLNGTVELTTRADKKVYIVAGKQGYANFTSTIVPVVSGNTQYIEAVLEKEILQGEVEIEFKGLYKGEKLAKSIAAGQEYEALFELRIPSNKNYDSVGMHVRTGDQGIIELDRILLKGLNVPGSAQVIRSTSYTPNTGYAIDSENISSGDAKWANIEWAAPSTGIVQVRVAISIRETAILGDQLNLFYRAWGEENGLYKRDPVDLELGEAESVAGKEGLYAKAKQEIFQLDIENICDKSFCFSASVLDEEEKLAYNATEGISARAFGPYRLTFSVLNNSDFEENSYLDAEIRVSNEDQALQLQEYRIKGAQNQERQGVVSGKSTDWVEAGNFLPNNSISGSVDFTPQKTGPGQILIEIRSGQMIRFSRIIYANVFSDKEFAVTVVPEMLPSGMENGITVTAKDNGTGAEIENALAKAKDRFGTVIAEKYTNAKGIAMLLLPALEPGEKLFLTVGKPGYAGFEKTLEVNPEVILVKPETIGVALNAKTKFESQNIFTVENRASFDLKIKSMKLNGQLYGLADKEKMENWLYAYVGETVKAGEIKELYLRGFLTEKGKKIQQAKSLEAELEITMEALGSEWTKAVPVKISIGLGGEVDDPTCFTITRKEWKGSTEGNPIEIQLEAQNNCSISGAPVSLRNISAQVEWQSNQTGNFSIRTAENSIELSSGYAKKFAGILGPEEKIAMVLEFSPNGGVNGKGIANIVFKAENPTESKAQELSNKLYAEIVTVNLIDCIAFSKDVLLIKPEASDKLVIQTVGCGARNEIRLDSELTVNNEKLSLGETDSKEVDVFAEKNIPGQYPIKVYAKGTDQVQEKLIKTIRARILASGCIELSRYEFDVFDNPNDPYDGYDTVEVINHCYDKPVTAHVKFDERDLVEAMKTGALVGLVTGLIGGFTRDKGTSFWTGQPNATQTAENTVNPKPAAAQPATPAANAPKPAAPATGGTGGSGGNPLAAVGAVIGGVIRAPADLLGGVWTGITGGNKPAGQTATGTPTGATTTTGGGTAQNAKTADDIALEIQNSGGSITQLDSTEIQWTDSKGVTWRTYLENGQWVNYNTTGTSGGTTQPSGQPASGTTAGGTQNAKTANDVAGEIGESGGNVITQTDNEIYWRDQTGTYWRTYLENNQWINNKSTITSGGTAGQADVYPPAGSTIGTTYGSYNTITGRPAGQEWIAPDGSVYIVKDTGDVYKEGDDGMYRKVQSASTANQAPAEDWTAAPTGLFFGTGQQGGVTGLLGGVVGGIGKAVMGKGSFLSWGLQGFIVGTAIAYFMQDKDEFSFTTIHDDLVYKGIALLMPGATLEDDKLVETPSTDIIVKDLEETSTAPNAADPRLSIEKRKLGFLNVGGVVQKDPATPLYRVLRVDGERLVYETEYELDKEKTPSLSIKERKADKERFRLQFNAFDPMTVKPDLRPISNCTLGNLVGVTGPDAVPKVSFNWDWAKINENSCDESNPDYIYCDATQFSIEVLKKVQKLREFIESNRPFDCPTSAAAVAVEEQKLVQTGQDVGITRIQASRVGSSDVNVAVTMESNNAQSMNAELRIYLKQGSSVVKSCTRQFSLISKVTESCNLAGIGEGEYTIDASIVPILCSGCGNSDAGNDVIKATLFIGAAGIAECEPYNTKRLVQFLEAGDYSASQIEQVQKLISFNANLMEDAYTADFRSDFDDFCSTKSFFDCPSYYLETEGLHSFFADP